MPPRACSPRGSSRAGRSCAERGRRDRPRHRGQRRRRSAAPRTTRRDVAVAHRRARRAARSDPDRLVAPGQSRQHRHAVPRLGRARPGHADGCAHDRGRGARALDGPGDRGAGRHERVALGFTVGSSSTLDRDGADEPARGRGRGADAAPEHGVGAARRPGRRACPSRTASSRGGGKTVKYSDLDGREAVQQHDRGGEGDAHEPGELQADRDAGPADRHPGIVTGKLDLRPEHPRARHAPRPGRAAARPGGARPGRDRARASTRARSRTSRTCRWSRRATSSASSHRTSTTRSRRRRS